jgi:hypothetical protein
MYRLRGCCSSGPATFGQDETGSEVAAEQGAMTALGPAARDHDVPWAKLFGVSVLAGLTINYLTRRKG